MTRSAGLLEQARRLAGLSRSELARRAGASRPTLAAYAAGTKSPNLASAERIVRAAGFDLDLVPRPDFREAAIGRGRAVFVPTVLPRLPVDRALGRVRLPLHLNWSQPGREFDLADRCQRPRPRDRAARRHRTGQHRLHRRRTPGGPVARADHPSSGPARMAAADRQNQRKHGSLGPAPLQLPRRLTPSRRVRPN
jgi:transcriptional regulator with XRE-family HTH domain